MVLVTCLTHSLVVSFRTFMALRTCWVLDFNSVIRTYVPFSWIIRSNSSDSRSTMLSERVCRTSFIQHYTEWEGIQSNVPSSWDWMEPILNNGMIFFRMLLFRACSTASPGIRHSERDNRKVRPLYAWFFLFLNDGHYKNIDSNFKQATIY